MPLGSVIVASPSPSTTTLIALTGTTGGLGGVPGTSSSGMYTTSSPPIIALTPSPSSTSSGSGSITAPEALTMAFSIFPLPVTVAGAFTTRLDTDDPESSTSSASVAVSSMMISSAWPSSTITLPASVLMLRLPKSPDKTTWPSAGSSSIISVSMPSPSGSCSMVDGALTRASSTLLPRMTILTPSLLTVRVTTVELSRMTLSEPPPLTSSSPSITTSSNTTVPSPTLSAMSRLPLICMLTRVTSAAVMMAFPSMTVVPPASPYVPSSVNISATSLSNTVTVSALEILRVGPKLLSG